MTNIHVTRSLIIGGLTALMGMQGAYANQVANCADWNPCCFDYGLNPPLTCPTCCGCAWYGEIDFLYWKPFVENAHPAVLVTSNRIDFDLEASPEATTSHTVARNKDFNFDWDSGFRVAFGYGFPCDKWGLAVTWTHYRTDANFADSGFRTLDTTTGTADFFRDIRIPVPGFLDSEQAGALLSLEGSTLTSKWDFQFNQIDLDFFRDYYVGCSLSLKPYVGLRALIIKNTIHTFAQYDGIESAISSSAPFSQLAISQRLRSDFKSFGLKGGLESFWEAMCGLGVYGNVGASVVYANYETLNNTQAAGTEGSNSSLRIVNETELPYLYQALKFMSDLSIGIQWRQAINCNQNMIVIKAGWEHHMILQGSQFQTLRTNTLTFDEDEVSFSLPKPASSAGDISLYGFVFSIGFSF